jgi:3' exoribonuclease, RNase T-like
VTRKVFYDFEFLEDGRTITPISVGMVDDEGREYYAVNGDAPLRRAWWSPWRKTRIERHPWLMSNVVPHLPRPHGDWINHMPRSWLIDYTDPAVKPLATIAYEVHDYLVCHQPVDDLELWAWYGAFDHVSLAWLWGPMSELPPGIPMYTNDIRQEAQRLGNPRMPVQDVGVHNALADARHNKVRWDYLRAVAAA